MIEYKDNTKCLETNLYFELLLLFLKLRRILFITRKDDIY